jgi:hypothetical protein
LSTFSIRYGARNRAYFIAKHLSWVYRSVFNVLYPSYYVLMHLVGRDNRQRCRTQLAAWAEGMRILKDQQLNRTASAREPNEVRDGS